MIKIIFSPLLEFSCPAAQSRFRQSCQSSRHSCQCSSFHQKSGTQIVPVHVPGMWRLSFEILLNSDFSVEPMFFYLRRVPHRKFEQCCGSGRFLTWSRSDFRKRPDPDPGLHKILAKFLVEIFLVEICPKKFIHEQKSKARWFPKVFMAFSHTKKLILGHLLRPWSGSDQKGLDPTGSGSATRHLKNCLIRLRVAVVVKIKFRLRYFKLYLKHLFESKQGSYWCKNGFSDFAGSAFHRIQICLHAY
jgi:hypothetical protein